jgi:ribosomal protein S18 acetylase RimI-like enzyme
LSDLPYDSFRRWRPFFSNFAGAEVHGDDAFSWWTSDPPYPLFNGLYGVTDDVDAALAPFEGRACVWVAPDPNELNLERHGFHVDHEAGMELDLVDLPDDPTDVEDVTADPELLEVATSVTLLGSGFPLEAVDPFLSAIRAYGSDSLRTYFATHEGTPAAGAVVHLYDEIAALYNVATLEEFRGRGLGRAVSLTALRDARERGATRGVLLASRMGAPVYRKLGFAETSSVTFAVRA